MPSTIRSLLSAIIPWRPKQLPAPVEPVAMQAQSSPAQFSITRQHQPAPPPRHAPRHAPRVSVNAAWTKPRLKLALSGAESGKFLELGDLIEEMIATAEIRAAFDLRIGAMQSLELDADGDDDVVRAFRGYWFVSGGLYPETTDDGDLVEGEHWIPGDFDRMFPPDLIYMLQASALMGGLTWLQQCDAAYDSETGRLVPSHRVWNLRHFQHLLTTGWHVATSTTEGGARAALVPLSDYPDEWYQYTPFGSDRPWARGLWRGLRDPWLLAIFAYSDWGKYSESKGKGLLIGKMPRGSGEQILPSGAVARDQFCQSLYDAGEYGAIAIDADQEVDPLEFSADTYKSFEAQLERLKHAASVGILGGDLPQNASGGGSYAAIREQAQLLYDGLIKPDFQRMFAFLAAGPLRRWLEWNFPPGRKAPVGRYILPDDESAAEKDRLELESRRATTRKAQLEALAQAKALDPSVDVRQALAEMGYVLGTALAGPAAAVTYTAPQDVATEAALGLGLYQAWNKPGVKAADRRGSPAAARMARKLKSGQPLDRGDLIDITAYTTEMETQGSLESGWGDDVDPSDFWIDFRCYGGEPGRTWAAGLMDAADVVADPIVPA